MSGKSFVLMIALGALSAVGVSAADISGKWVAQVPGRGGDPIETTFNFKVEAGNLTGTVSANFGGQAFEQQITEGKVSGEDVSFVTVLSFPGGGGGGGEFKFVYKGKIAGSEIKFTRTFSGSGGFGGGGEGPPPQEFVAKKSN